MTILQYTLILLYFFLPLQFALNPHIGIDLAIVRIIIVFLFFFFLVYGFYTRSFIVPLGWHCALLTFFAVLPVFSMFYSPVLPWTLRKILFLLNIFPLYYILVTVFRSQTNYVLHLCKFIVCGAFLASLIGICQFSLQFIISLHKTIFLWSSITPFFLGGSFSSSVTTYNSWLVHVGGQDIMRVIGFFPDPHVFAFYLGLITPLSCTLYVHTKHKFWILVTITLIITDLLTFSRGGYIALFSGLLLYIAISWKKMRASTKKIMFITLFSLVFFLLIPHNPITERLLSSFDTSDHSNTHRIFLWQQAFGEIIQRPLLGSGIGAYSAIIDPTANYRTPIYVHNLYLDITVELGLIGLVSFLALIFRTLYIFYRQKDASLALFAIISMGIFLTHAFFDSPLFSVHVFPILLFFFALASYYEQKNTL